MQMIHMLLFSLFLAVSSCRLGTTSRDNQVQPEVFEMFYTSGSSVPLSFTEHSSHQLCVYMCQCAHTQGPDLLSWERLVEPFSLQTPLGEPC